MNFTTLFSHKPIELTCRKLNIGVEMGVVFELLPDGKKELMANRSLLKFMLRHSINWNSVDLYNVVIPTVHTANYGVVSEFLVVTWKDTKHLLTDTAFVDFIDVPLHRLIPHMSSYSTTKELRTTYVNNEISLSATAKTAGVLGGYTFALYDLISIIDNEVVLRGLDDQLYNLTMPSIRKLAFGISEIVRVMRQSPSAGDLAIAYIESRQHDCAGFFLTHSNLCIANGTPNSDKESLSATRFLSDEYLPARLESLNYNKGFGDVKESPISTFFM